MTTIERTVSFATLASLAFVIACKSNDDRGPPASTVPATPASVVPRVSADGGSSDAPPTDAAVSADARHAGVAKSIGGGTRTRVRKLEAAPTTSDASLQRSVTALLAPAESTACAEEGTADGDPPPTFHAADCEIVDTTGDYAAASCECVDAGGAQTGAWTIALISNAGPQLALVGLDIVPAFDALAIKRLDEARVDGTPSVCIGVAGRRGERPVSHELCFAR